jgi:hypothetical protein
MPNEPQLEFLYEISAYLESPIAIGENPHGNRQIVPVTGGSFEGPRLKGKVLPGGGDWLLVRPDGVGELDVRATLQTDDGAFIYVTYRGYITKILASKHVAAFLSLAACRWKSNGTSGRRLTGNPP